MTVRAFQIDKPCFRVMGPEGAAAIVPISQEILDQSSFEDVWQILRSEAAEAIGETLGRDVSVVELGTVMRFNEAVIEGDGTVISY